MDLPQILLTNDDGIQSPGLWAAAKALAKLGKVHIIAPRDQQSGSGRSMPVTTDGRIERQEIDVDGETWVVFAVGGTPAQAVMHAMHEILPKPPDLAVSGINYGENLGSGVTISGTVGGALEAAANGVPSLAISLETPGDYHLTHSTEINFSSAAYFTAKFARLLLKRVMPPDVDVLKVDIPSDATRETPWEMTHLPRKRYYDVTPPTRDSLNQPGKFIYQQTTRPDQFPPRSDVFVVRVKRVISVTPLSFDLTSRVNLDQLAAHLRL